MHRQLYPALMLTTLGLAAAVLMRPMVGNQLMSLAQSRGTNQYPARSGTSYPPAPQWIPGDAPPWPSQPPPDRRPDPTAADAAGEAFISDSPLPSQPAIAPNPPPFPYRSNPERQPTFPPNAPAPSYGPVGQAPRRTVDLPFQHGHADGADDDLNLDPPPQSPAPGRPPFAPRPSAESDRPALGVNPTASPTYPIAGRSRYPQQPDYPAAPTYPVAGAGRQASPEPAAPELRSVDGSPPNPPGRTNPYPRAGASAGVPRFDSAAPPYPPTRESAPRFDRPARGRYDRPPLAPEARTGIDSPVAAEVKLCEGAQILARVGPKLILACEAKPIVDDYIAQNQDKISPDELDDVRKIVTMKVLDGLIDRKLVYEDARRSIPKEGIEHLEKQLAEHFEEEVLPKRIKDAGAGSRRELDEMLQKKGTSLDQQKRSFVEQGVGDVWRRDQGKSERDVSHDEMLAYYHEHIADFSTPARARWQHLWIRPRRYTDGSEAWAKLARLGNELMRGARVEELLKEQSKEEPACRGGSEDWTVFGSGEVSEVLEHHILNLPVGTFSRIFRDEEGFHIVRVLEREEATRTPFEEADQAQIREKIRQARQSKRREEYVASLRREIPVWTVFDNDPAIARFRRQSESARK